MPLDFASASAPVPVEMRDSHDGLEVYLKIVDGGEHSRILLPLKLSDTVGQVKAMIQEKKGIPVDEQKLIFSGKFLKDDIRLEGYNITGSDLHNIIVKHVTKADETAQREQSIAELQTQLREIEALPQKHAREIEQLRQSHTREIEQLRQRKDELESRIQGLMGGGNRVRRRRNSRKTKQTRK